MELKEKVSIRVFRTHVLRYSDASNHKLCEILSREKSWAHFGVVAPVGLRYINILCAEMRHRLLDIALTASQEFFEEFVETLRELRWEETRVRRGYEAERDDSSTRNDSKLLLRLLYETKCHARTDIAEILARAANDLGIPPHDAVREAVFTRACMTGNEAVVRQMLAEGMTMNVFGSSQDPLYEACKAGHRTVVDLLMASGRGWDPIHGILRALKTLPNMGVHLETIERLLDLISDGETRDQVHQKVLYSYCDAAHISSNVYRMRMPESILHCATSEALISRAPERIRLSLLRECFAKLQRWSSYTYSLILYLISVAPNVIDGLSPAETDILRAAIRSRDVETMDLYYLRGDPSVLLPFLDATTIYHQLFELSTSSLRGNEHIRIAFFQLAAHQWRSRRQGPPPLDAGAREMAMGWILSGVEELIETAGPMFVRSWLRGTVPGAAPAIETIERIERDIARLLQREACVPGRDLSWSMLPRDVAETILAEAGWVPCRDFR